MEVSDGRRVKHWEGLFLLEIPDRVEMPQRLNVVRLLHLPVAQLEAHFFVVRLQAHSPFECGNDLCVRRAVVLQRVAVGPVRFGIGRAQLDGSAQMAERVIVVAVLSG